MNKSLIIRSIFAIFMLLVTVQFALAVPTVTITPSNPIDTNDLTCDVTESNDIFDYVWVKNGQQQGHLSTRAQQSTIPSSETSVGDSWLCHAFFPLRSIPVPNNAGPVTIGAVPPTPACVDGIDNDGDGLIDGDDPGCDGTATDDDETDPVPGNMCPAFSVTSIPDQHTHPGAMFAFAVPEAQDGDGDPVTYSVLFSTIPTRDFRFNSATRIFQWTPNGNQLGGHTLVFGASDGNCTTGIHVRIDVENEAPVIDAPRAISVQESQRLFYFVRVRDHENHQVNLSVAGLPQGAAFAQSSTDPNLYRFIWTPDSNDAGTYTVRYMAVDQFGAMSQASTIIDVVDFNRPPILDPIGPQSVPEGTLLSIMPTGRDPDGDPVTFSIRNVPGQLFPAGVTFVNNEFRWTPTAAQAGQSYFVRFVISDGRLEDTEDVRIDVLLRDANIPPILDPIGPQTIISGNTLTINPTGTDPDGGPVTFSIEPVPGQPPIPAGVTFVNNQFQWTPTALQLGVHMVRFVITDRTGLRDFEDVPIQVARAGNNPPTARILQPVGAVVVVDQGQSLFFAGNGTDPDGDALTFRWDFGTLFPTVFTNQVPGRLTPMRPGRHVVTFTVTDTSGATGTDTVVIIVNAVPNQNPVVSIDSPANNVEVLVGVPVDFQATATDPDGHALRYKWTFGGAHPPLTTEDPGLLFLNRTGTFTVTFMATDVLGGSSSENITIRVRAPECSDGDDNDGDGAVDFGEDTDCTSPTDDSESGPPRGNEPIARIDSPSVPLTVITAGDSIVFEGTAIPSITATRVKTSWDFNNDGIVDSLLEDPGRVAFPVAGRFKVIFRVRDDAGLEAMDMVRIDVREPGANLPPVVRIESPTGNPTIVRDGQLDFQGFAFDPDGDPLTFNWTFDGAAPDATVEDPGIITFSTTGTFTIRFSASDGMDTTTATVIVTVIDSTTPPACRDGVDNDGDGSIDFPADPGCASPDDTDELNPSTGTRDPPRNRTRIRDLTFTSVLLVQGEEYVIRSCDGNYVDYRGFAFNDNDCLYVLQEEDSVRVFVTIRNDNRFDIENLVVTVDVPEMDMRRTQGPFTVGPRKEVRKILDFDIPEYIDRDIYDMRISVHNAETSKTIWRDVEIVGQRRAPAPTIHEVEVAQLSAPQRPTSTTPVAPACPQVRNNDSILDALAKVLSCWFSRL